MAVSTSSRPEFIITRIQEPWRINGAAVIPLKLIQEVSTLVRTAARHPQQDLGWTGAATQSSHNKQARWQVSGSTSPSRGTYRDCEATCLSACPNPRRKLLLARPVLIRALQIISATLCTERSCSIFTLDLRESQGRVATLHISFCRHGK